MSLSYRERGRKLRIVSEYFCSRREQLTGNLQSMSEARARSLACIRKDLLDLSFEPRHAAYLWLAQLPEDIPVSVAFLAPPGDRHRGDWRSGVPADRLDLDAAVGEPVDFQGSNIEHPAGKVRPPGEFARGCPPCMKLGSVRPSNPRISSTRKSGPPANGHNV